MEKRILNFTIYYDEKDIDIADECQKIIENTFSKLHALFNIETDDKKYNFYICKDVQTFMKLTNKTEENYRSWMVGYSDNTSKICVLSPKLKNNKNMNYFKKIVTHELVHLLVNSSFKKPTNSIWLDEGLAILLSNQTNLDYVNLNEYPKIEKISENNSIAFAANQGYTYAGIYVWYLIKLVGESKFIYYYEHSNELSKLNLENFEENAIKSYILENRKENE